MIDLWVESDPVFIWISYQNWQEIVQIFPQKNKMHSNSSLKSDTRKTQKWVHSYWKVLKITWILMYVLTPRDFEFQRKPHLLFPSFWIRISQKFHESSVKFCHTCRMLTLKKRYQLWHLRFDSFLILKYLVLLNQDKKISHFGEKNYGLIKITKPSQIELN